MRELVLDFKVEQVEKLGEKPMLCLINIDLINRPRLLLPVRLVP